MNRKVVLIVSIIILFILCIFLIFKVYKKDIQRREKKNDETKEKIELESSEKRYNEIRESIKKAMDWHIEASLVIKNEDNCKVGHRVTWSSQLLIKYGFLKQKEMLDVDEKSYCKAMIVEYMGENCTMKYDIYLSCKDYEDEGYYDLGF